jgi:hypothetical protein
VRTTRTAIVSILAALTFLGAAGVAGAATFSVLPQPEGPSSAMISPARVVSVTLSTATIDA